MTPLGTLAKAFKVTALVVLLSLAWAVPLYTHAGHGAASRTVAPAAEPLQHDTRTWIAAASFAVEATAP